MLQDIRNNSQSTAAKVIVGLIIVVFALFGVESIVGGLGGEPEVATVNGEAIAESDFLRALEGKRRQIIAQMGDRADPDLIDEGLLRSSVLEGMIEEEILRQDADIKGLYISDASVDGYIRQIEQFKVDGNFDNARMQMILRNVGLTLQDYRDSLKKQFVMQQPRSAIIGSAFVLEEENKEVIALDRQQRTFGVASVKKSDYLDAVAVGDEEVNAYYEENKSSFKKPENVDVSFVEVKKSDLAEGVDVSDADLEALYEIEKQGFEGEEQRHAAHLLIKIDDERSEEQALELVKAAADRLAKGEEFALVAKELSEDEGSAADGGDLGVSAKGVYVSDFEDALYALSVNEVSDPVKTEFGYHLIKLLGVERNEIPSLDEMKDSLLARIKGEKADQLYADLIEQLADISYSSPDLAEPADELELQVKELAGVSALSQDAVFSSVKIQRVLFSEELVKDQNNSELIEVGDGHAVVFRVNAYHDESIKALAEVREDIRQKLAAMKAEEYAASVGQAFLARVAGGEDPQVVSDEMGLNWKVHNEMRRDNVTVDRELLARIFATRLSDDLKSNVHGFEMSQGDFAVYKLTSVSDGELDQVTELEQRSIDSMISDSLGAGDYRSYQDVMIRDAEIERI